MRAGTHTTLTNRRWAWTEVPDAPFSVTGESYVLAVGRDTYLVIAATEGGETSAATYERRRGWRWFPAPPLEASTGAAAAASQNGAFLWSGIADANVPNDLIARRFHDTGAIYSPSNGWMQTPAAPVLPRAYASSHWTPSGIAVWGGWRPGGQGESVALRDGVVFNPKEMTWKKIPDSPALGSIALQPMVYSGSSLICMPNDTKPIVRMSFESKWHATSAAHRNPRRIVSRTFPAYEYDIAAENWRALTIEQDLTIAFLAAVSGGDIVGLRSDGTMFRWRRALGSFHEETSLPVQELPIDVVGLVPFRSGLICVTSDSPERLSAWYWERNDGWSEIPSPPNTMSNRDGLTIVAANDAILIWGGRIGDVEAPRFCRDGALLSELAGV